MATIPAILPKSDAIKPGKTYEPSNDYLAVSDLDLKSGSPKKLLILDLNGTLISRIDKRKGASFFARPYINTFLDYIFSDYNVMVWSSAQEQNVNRFCNVFGDRPLFLKWHRGNFGLTISEFNSNAEALKDLNRVWDEFPQYNATNTVVVDDTTIKLSLQPHNLIEISTFDHTSKTSDNALLQLMDYLKLLKDEPNVAFYIKNNSFIEVENTEETCTEGPIEFEYSGQLKRPGESTEPIEISKKKKKPRHKKKIPTQIVETVSSFSTSSDPNTQSNISSNSPQMNSIV